MNTPNILDKKYNFLRPIKINSLVRLGQKADGGYVVDLNIVNNCKTLVSLGLGSDWSFELDFIKKNNDASLFIYDHTIQDLPYKKQIWKYLKRFLTFRASSEALKKRIKNYNEYKKFFQLKNINFYKEKITYPIKDKIDTDIRKIFSRIDNNSEVILKSDIESSEYLIVDQLIEYSTKIQMLIIEFHYIDKNEKVFIESIQKLKTRFEIIHIHGNNHFPALKDGLPAVLEISFINKKFSPKEFEYNSNFPIKNLDFPNNPYLEDISFSFK